MEERRNERRADLQTKALHIVESCVEDNGLKETQPTQDDCKANSRVNITKGCVSGLNIAEDFLNKCWLEEGGDEEECEVDL
jgi:hypothetical protein